MRHASFGLRVIAAFLLLAAVLFAAAGLSALGALVMKRLPILASLCLAAVLLSGCASSAVQLINAVHQANDGCTVKSEVTLVASGLTPPAGQVHISKECLPAARPPAEADAQ